ncbi:hypothetical protein [Stenotrophomonas maltophilia]|uniref:hypothetical protein n=1 Tax=Stenotrophomonas maltophilia TaxID=40324 RepID=UPI0039F6BE78
MPHLRPTVIRPGVATPGRQERKIGHGLDETYHGDKLKPMLWRVDPTQLQRHKDSGTSRRAINVRGSALIDLSALQQCVRTGALRPDDVWVATHKAQRDLENLRWTLGDLLDCLLCLQAEDYKGSEWCKDQLGTWHPCDAYAVRYDDVRKRRLHHSDINYYLKFSIGKNGSLRIVLLSCHL